uniref:L-dopachrome isomerase n=1 Tax=Trichuris muris TaxID=70415 RepID=A0A5S6QL37_TRIMR
MPIFTFATNVPADKISGDFLKSTSKLVADMLGKPESYVAVHINGGQKMTFGGSDGPAGFGQLLSIGGVGGERNRSHSAKLFKHITDNLGIPGNRMYINFVDMRGSDVGWNGTTF